MSQKSNTTKRTDNGRSLWRSKLRADVPRDLEPMVMRLLKCVERYMPTWCRDVHVMFQHQGDDLGVNAAQTTSDVEYQKATLEFFPPLLDETDEQRYATVVHEVGHLCNAELYDLTFQVIDTLADESSKPMLLRLLKRAAESSAENFKHAMLEAEQRKDVTR